MVEVFGLLEHVLAEDAVVEAGRGDRAHMVEAPAPIAFARRTALRVPSILVVISLARIGVEIVDRGQMEEMIDLALELLDVIARKAQSRLGNIAFQRNRALRARIPKCAQATEPFGRGIAHQKIDHGIGTRYNAAHQSLADKAAGARDEVNHRLSPTIQSMRLFGRPTCGHPALTRLSDYPLGSGL